MHDKNYNSMALHTMEAIAQTGLKSVYDLIWGQCSNKLRSRLRGHTNLTTFSTNRDSILLLTTI